MPNYWRRGVALALGLGAAATVSSAAATAQTVPVKVTATQDSAEAPLSVVVPSARLNAKRALPKGATPTVCQSEPAGPGQVRLTWIARGLKKGESRTFELAPAKETAADKTAGVTLKQNGANVDILVNNSLFTRYDTTTGPNKPYFYPVNGPTGKPVTRHWPVEDTVPGETRDHPHHRGLWFTHGEMNGVDFWTEVGAKTGKTIHTGYENLVSGPVYGHLRAKADWVTSEGRKIASDVRDVTVYAVQNGYLMDFAIAVKAEGGPLHWGDTKEGTFSIRVADSMRGDAGKGKTAEGHIENARGDVQDATWGKPAAWCDYYGPVDGEVVGIAILDSPQNLRHPTTWHVRTYGLFAVNPFGLHDFDPALKNNKTAGEHITPEGQATTFRYRIFLHKGGTKDANIPAVWSAYADPPRVEVL